MICNCTLAGTDACNHCNNNSSVSEFNFKVPEVEIAKKVIDYQMAVPILQYWCSGCDALLIKYARFCHNCGAIIDWGSIEEEQ